MEIDLKKLESSNTENEMNSTINVALVCNMNNNLFSLGRYLCNAGINPVLYVLPFEHNHFKPESDSTMDKLPYAIKHLSWGNPYELDKVTSDEIFEEFKGYDFIVGCGTSPAYLSKAGLKLDLFSPYGTDLIEFPFPHHLRPWKLAKYVLSFIKKSDALAGTPMKMNSGRTNFMGYLPFIFHQRKGIREATACSFPTSGIDIYARALKRLNFKKRHYPFGLPMIYVPEYSQEGIQQLYAKSTLLRAFKQIRSNSDFLIFNNCRHSWKESDKVMHKGNNRLFIGFADFIKNFKGRASIITFEYGADVEESKKLISNLGISEYVKWFPVTSRKELMVGLSLSDLVVGNLSDASYPVYGVVYEALALGKPIMHHRQDELYTEEMLYPMINAYNSIMVTEALQYYSAHKDEMEKMGQESNKWFLKNFIETPLQTIVDLIKSKKQ